MAEPTGNVDQSVKGKSMQLSLFDLPNEKSPLCASVFEDNFRVWAEDHDLPLDHTGTGKIWIVRRNPDFRVVRQKKAIELTQATVFTPNQGNVKRTPKNYGIPTLEHYEKHGWHCLVVFLKRGGLFSIPPELKPVIEDFSSPASNWSGIWDYSRLISSDD